MRIGFVTTEYVTEGDYFGGLANYLHRVASALAARGHEIHVITHSPSDSVDVARDGIFVHRVVAGRHTENVNRLTRYRFPHSSKWIAVSTEIAQRLRSLHGRTPFDVCQYPNYLVPGLVSSMLVSVPYVLRLSSLMSDWHRAGRVVRDRDLRLLEFLEMWHIRRSRNVYAPSDALIRMIASRTPGRQIRRIRSPFFLEVPKERWDYSPYCEHLEGRQYILYFGRLQEHKGFSVLLDAAPAILDQIDDASLVCVGQDMPGPGGGSYRAYAESALAAYDGRAVFLPSLRHEQLYPMIHNSRLVVLPSLVDNYPNACLESMALQRPVVGTRGASFEEIIDDGENGFLVEIGDAEDLARCVRSAWSRTDLARVGRAAEATVEDMSRTAIDELEHYLSSVARSPRTERRLPGIA